MPLLKPEFKQPTATLTCKLRSEDLEDLTVYSKVIESTPDYVVTMALRKLFSDPEFQGLRTSQPELWAKRGATPKASKANHAKEAAA